MGNSFFERARAVSASFQAVSMLMACINSQLLISKLLQHLIAYKHDRKTVHPDKASHSELDCKVIGACAYVNCD